MTYITPNEIARAEQLGACRDSIKWLRKKPRTWDEVVERYVVWLLRRAAVHLTPERLDACASAEPWAALAHAHDLLTPERLDACAAACPDTALRFAHDRLTPERLDACAAACPATALVHAHDLLTPERLEACSAACPGIALVMQERLRVLEGDTHK